MSAADLIEQFWPDHHTCLGRDGYGTPTQTEEDGVICGCGTMLGFPAEEPPADEPEPDTTWAAGWTPKDPAVAATLAEQRAAIAAARAAADGGTRLSAAQPGETDEQHLARLRAEQEAEYERTAEMAGGGNPEGPEQPPEDDMTDLPYDDPASYPSAARAAADGPRTGDGFEEYYPSAAAQQEAERELAEYERDQEEDARAADEAQAVLDGTYGEPPEQVAAAAAAVVQRATERTTTVRPDSAITAADPIRAEVDVIDPTQVYTPANVERQMVSVLARLERGELFLRHWLDIEARAEHAYLIKYNKALAASEARSADLRKAEAVLATEAEAWAKTEANMMVRATRDTLHSLRAELTGWQSVARSIGASLQGPDPRRH